MAPRFLELDELVQIHRELIEAYGGSDGVRDLGLLKSATAMPAAGIGGEYFHRDLFEMAAAYLFHLVQNHPFIDGNKRTAASAAFLFLWINGWELVMASEEDFEQLVRQAATGSIDKPSIADELRRSSRPRSAGDDDEPSGVAGG